MEGTVFTPALEKLQHVKSEQGEILTMPFLDACKQILPVIGTCSFLLTCLMVKDREKLEMMYVYPCCLLRYVDSFLSCNVYLCCFVLQRHPIL